MRILTYKRTHTGDPNSSGQFGIDDCMGSVRKFRYDAVIGVGGHGPEPKSKNIDGKITWVGRGPKRGAAFPGYRAEIVTFKDFVLFDAAGPLLESKAPTLAKRLARGARYVFGSYSSAEQREAEQVIEWAFAQSQKSRLPKRPKRKSGGTQASRCSTSTCSPSDIQLTPNQPLERTPPRCALRRRSRAR